MEKNAKFAALLQRFCLTGSGASRNATRLWNWADHQSNPEQYWQVLQRACPAMFGSASANSFRFSYAGAK